MLVEQWIDFSVHEIELPAAVWIFPIQGKIPNNPLATDRAKQDIRKSLQTLNVHLLDNTYLVGNRITLADIVVASSLYYLYELVLDPNFRKEFVATNRWFSTLVNQPEFKAVLGEVKLATQMIVAKEGGVAAAPSKPKEEKKAPAKAEPKKEEKKPEPKKEEKKPKKKDDDDEEEEENFEDAPKGKNPLDSLAPTKLNLDEWKRVYSNEDTRTKAIPWFWENYDAEGYSLWVAEYKYPDENTVTFMTCNLVGGFIQRLDKLRKYGFGTVLLFGEEPRIEIAACWLFRGKEIPEEMTTCDDYTNYDWKKIDTNDTAQRELVNDFWAWEGSFGGRATKFTEGKAFK